MPGEKKSLRSASRAAIDADHDDKSDSGGTELTESSVAAFLSQHLQSPFGEEEPAVAPLSGGSSRRQSRASGERLSLVERAGEFLRGLYFGDAPDNPITSVAALLAETASDSSDEEPTAVRENEAPHLSTRSSRVGDRRSVASRRSNRSAASAGDVFSALMFAPAGDTERSSEAGFASVDRLRERSRVFPLIDALPNGQGLRIPVKGSTPLVTPRNQYGGTSAATFHSVDDEVAGGFIQYRMRATTVWPIAELKSRTDSFLAAVNSIDPRNSVHVFSVPPPRDLLDDYGPPVEVAPLKLVMKFPEESILGSCSAPCGDRRMGWPWMMLVFITCSVGFLIEHTQDFTDVPDWLLLVFQIFSLVITTAHFVQYSFRIVVRLFCTFDVFVLLFWSGVLAWCNARAVNRPDVGRLVVRVIVTSMTVLCAVFLDAIRIDRRYRRATGVVFAAVSLAMVSLYVLWRVATSEAYREQFEADNPNQNIDLGSFFRKVHIATLAQCGSATLAAYFARLSFRVLFNRSDCGVLQFGVTTGGHHRDVREISEGDWRRRVSRVLRRRQRGIPRSSSTVSVTNDNRQDLGTIRRSTTARRTNSSAIDTSYDSTGVLHPSFGSADPESILSGDVQLTLVRIYVIIVVEAGCQDVALRMSSLIPNGVVDPLEASLISRRAMQEHLRLRVFTPRRSMLSFPPRPLIRWQLYARLMRRPRCFQVQTVVFVALLVSVAVLNAVAPRMMGLHFAVRFAIIVISSALLLFGVSLPILANISSTLDFWFTFIQLPLTAVTSVPYYYGLGYSTLVVVTHVIMLILMSCVFVSLDAVIHTSHQRVTKGISMLLVVVYGAVSIVQSQQLINDGTLPAWTDVYDFGFARTSPGALAIATAFSLVVCELRIAFNLLVLKREMSFISFGVTEDHTARESLDTDDSRSVSQLTL